MSYALLLLIPHSHLFPSDTCRIYPKDMCLFLALAWSLEGVLLLEEYLNKQLDARCSWNVVFLRWRFVVI